MLLHIYDTFHFTVTQVEIKFDWRSKRPHPTSLLCTSYRLLWYKSIHRIMRMQQARTTNNQQPNKKQQPQYCILQILWLKNKGCAWSSDKWHVKLSNVDVIKILKQNTTQTWSLTMNLHYGLEYFEESNFDSLTV